MYILFLIPAVMVAICLFALLLQVGKVEE